ncbi:hypothetical protein AMELA_G00179940 [Ameiurus melas]|uniref:Uncharacterized protein n=1 Tax=Ameiurus melas TaxID=219545 RepID=A0A7J6A9L6_AMEME|nr:hypothetical protein AMELA_G00179940 [Ameiurus melas]
MFKIYMVVTVIGAFISASGATPAYIVLLRSIQPELKSLALGMQMLIVRTLDYHTANGSWHCKNQANSTEPEGNNIAIDNGNAPLFFVKCKEELDKETSI